MELWDFKRRILNEEDIDELTREKRLIQRIELNWDAIEEMREKSLIIKERILELFKEKKSN